MTSHINYNKEKAWFEEVVRYLAEIEKQLELFESTVIQVLKFNEKKNTSILQTLFAQPNTDTHNTLVNSICPLFRDIYRFWEQLRKGDLTSEKSTFKPAPYYEKTFFYRPSDQGSDQRQKTVLCVPFIASTIESQSQWLKREAKVKISQICPVGYFDLTSDTFFSFD